MSKKSPWCPRCGAHAYKFHGIYKSCDACGYCPHMEHKIRIVEQLQKNKQSLSGWEQVLKEIAEYKKNLKPIEQVKKEGWQIKKSWE